MMSPLTRFICLSNSLLCCGVVQHELGEDASWENFKEVKFSFIVCLVIELKDNLS